MPPRFGKKDKEGQTTVDSILSAADELAKLTNLKVQGMITEEEFIRMNKSSKILTGLKLFILIEGLNRIKPRQVENLRQFFKS